MDFQNNDINLLACEKVLYDGATNGWMGERPLYGHAVSYRCVKTSNDSSSLLILTEGIWPLENREIIISGAEIVKNGLDEVISRFSRGRMRCAYDKKSIIG